MVGVACLITLAAKGGAIKEARLALASVAPVPLRARRAEEILLSGSLSEERFQEAAQVAATESIPIGDMRASVSYRKEMVKVLTTRALHQALQLAQGGFN